MRHAFATLAALAVLGHAAVAQTTPPAHGRPSETPKPEQQLEPPLARTPPPVTAGPTLPPPPSPEAATPANPLRPAGSIEASPPPASADASTLPVPASAPPLQQTAGVNPDTAAYLQEIGIDPRTPEVVEVSQDTVGAYTLDALAAERDEVRVRRFIYTRTFLHRFLADSNHLHIEPDKYDIGFLTPEEVNLIADELSK